MTKKPKTEIYKFQKPLSSSEENPGVLVYNKSRSREGILPMTEELQKCFDAMGPKFYAKCIEVPDGKGVQILIDAIVIQQAW